MANETTEKSVFTTLNAINCNDHTEQKNNLTYLSWAWAWAEVKKAYPSASYTVYENAAGLNYHTDGRTCWVKTGVTIEGLEHIEYLPVMDFKNASIPADKVTSFDVNKAIQRSLTKACARHGLGLYIYAGEDLPEDAPKEKAAPQEESAFVAMSNKDFYKCVETYANGYEPENVGNVREYYIRKTHAGAKEIALFDEAVKNYKINQLKTQAQQ